MKMWRLSAASNKLILKKPPQRRGNRADRLRSADAAHLPVAAVQDEYSVCIPDIRKNLRPDAQVVC